MAQIGVPEQLNSESRVRHISPLFFSLQQLKKIYSQKTPNPSPLLLYTELTVICLWIQALQCQLKSYHFSSRGSSNTFPEATHNSLDPILSPLRRMFSRAHKFFMGTSSFVCPTRQVSKTFCQEAQVQNDQGVMGFPHTHTKSLPSHSYKLTVSLRC